MTRKQKRLLGIAIIGLVLACAAGLMAIGLRDEIVFYHEPTDVLVEQKVAPGERFRLGGLVVAGSIERDGTRVAFTVTDGDHSLPVAFDGNLPDLFRDGQGVIAEGKLEPSGTFIADNILAKHDENYIPKELSETLKKNQVWQGENSQ